MSKPRIHFVYSVPRSSRLLRRGVDKAITLSRVVPPLYRTGNDLMIPWRKPIRAPHSISYNLLHALKEHGQVRYYSLYEERTIKLRESDILIGVPAQEPGTMPWQAPNEHTIMTRTLRANPGHKNSYIIMPYSNEPHFVRWADELVRTHGQKLLLLAGKIWFDRWNESPWSNFPIEKKVRLDMGIDAEDYPTVKRRFNPKGKRGYLYIGHTSWYKNISQLEKIAAAMPQHHFGHVGLGRIKGWEQIADFADLDTHFMSKLADRYDCFVNVSSDAQVTTVLEQMCFGFFVACTPESGYDYPSLMPLSMTDTVHNVQQLTAFQDTDESVLLQTTAANRHIAETNHTWKQFSDAVIEFLNLR